MRDVGALLGQDDLGVRRDVDVAPAAATVGERDPADLPVVLRRDDHLERDGQGAIAPDDLRAVLRERHLVVVGLAPARLVAGRPALPAVGVAQQHVGAADVPRDVLPPPRDRQVAPAAVARARRRQHHRVAPVRQQVRARRRGVGRRESPGGGRHELAGVGSRRHLVGARAGHGDVARGALLQEQLGRLHAGVGVKPRAHDAVVQGVGDRQEQHALVVGHVGPHDHHRFPLGDPRARVVERLVVAVGAPAAGLGEALEVPDRRRRIHHGGQARRVGRDHHVLAEPAAQAQPRHAEVRVLVGHLEVAHVVGGLGHAPGDAALGAVGDLAPHDELRRLVEQAPRRRPHDEPGHEVLEHRAQPEPVRDRRVALGDRDEAGEAGFGGEQVVAARVERALADAEAEREQVALRIEEAAEVHAGDERLRDVGQAREACRQRLQWLEIARVTGHVGAHRLRPGQYLTRPRTVRLDQRVREAGHLLGAGGELGEACRPFGRRARRRCHGGRDDGEGAVQTRLVQPACGVHGPSGISIASHGMDRPSPPPSAATTRARISPRSER